MIDRFLLSQKGLLVFMGHVVSIYVEDGRVKVLTVTGVTYDMAPIPKDTHPDEAPEQWLKGQLL